MKRRRTLQYESDPEHQWDRVLLWVGWIVAIAEFVVIITMR